MPDQKPITLTQEELQRYVHLGCTTGFEELDPDDAHICRQVGLFFSVNPHLANYAVDIEELVLTPQGDDSTPPLAALTLTRKGITFRFASASEGTVPEWQPSTWDDQ